MGGICCFWTSICGGGVETSKEKKTRKNNPSSQDELAEELLELQQLEAQTAVTWALLEEVV